MNTTKQLYQWDINQMLVDCTGLYVDFPINGEIYRVETKDGECLIPDEFLQAGGRQKIWECMPDCTRKEFVLEIKARPMPPDYAFTPKEKLTFDGLVKRVDDAIADMIRRADSGEFDGYTPVKGKDYFTADEIKQIQDEVSSGAVGDFKSVVDTETETFNINAETKLNEFNVNAESNLTEYNDNATEKLNAYNSNAEIKVTEYNQNDTNKTAEYNSNAETKIDEYNTNANNRVAEFDSHTEQIQTDISGLKNDLAYIANMRDSVNLFNKNDVLVGKDLSVGSGKTYDSFIDNTICNVSNIIAVEPNGVYTGNSLFFGNSRRIYQYTSSGYYAGGNDGVDNGDGTYTYSLGSNASFVRFSYNNEAIFDADNYMFVKGSSIPSNYESYGDRIVDDGYVKKLNDKIDANVSDIHGRIDNLEAKTPIAELCDKIDHSKVTRYGFINGGVDGEVVTDSSYSNLWYSDFTDVIGGKRYYYGGYIAPIYFAFYDENKSYISGYGNTAENRLPNPFIVPANAKYVRFTCMTSSSSAPYNCWINIVNEAPSYTEDKYYDDSKMFMKAKVNNPCDHDGDSFSIFNNVICIGDSITEGTFNHNESGTMQYLVDGKYSYPTYLKKLSGVETVNKGMGGYTSVQWWNARQSDDFSGYDCAIINLGINDALQSVSLADTTSALNNIINALKSANNNIKIFMATVVPAYSDGTSAFDSVNNTIKSVCEANDCYLIDLSLYSHVKKYTVSEAGHLTAFGYYRLAKDYISAISYIIDNNRNDFKWIQFTGTDYIYN